MTYVDKARDALLHELPGIDYQLLDLYTLLVLVKGEEVTHEDVHHAWAMWTRQREPDHRYMLPFDELSPEAQELDKPYADAIKAVAAKMLNVPRETSRQGVSMFHETTIEKVFEHPLEDGSGTLICFTLDGVPDHAFWGASDWFPLLEEAAQLRTSVRVMYSEPEPPAPCSDPLCGDGCCDDPHCTNVPEEERTTPYLLRADTIEWL